MKVLKKAIWSKKVKCTGAGNGGGGCGSLLEVERGDLHRTSHQSYGDSSPDHFTTIVCPECKEWTDITTPFDVMDLPKLTR